jgi:hypothetical protein
VTRNETAIFGVIPRFTEAFFAETFCRLAPYRLTGRAESALPDGVGNHFRWPRSLQQGKSTVTHSIRKLSESDTSTKRWTAHRLALGAILFASMAAIAPARASSHMDAPLITLDAAANTTDVYAFLTQPPNGQKFLSTAVAVFPFEHPGIGPNTFRFDDRVAYDINISLDSNNISQGKTDLTYRFRFKTVFAPDTILSFGGLVQPDRPGVFPVNQNLRQTYTVTLIDRRISQSFPFITKPVVLGTGMVPPNNQGRVTPFYNQNNDGDRPAKLGVANPNDLDDYTKNTIFELKNGHRVFAGQRDDGFYGDIQSIFDLEFSFGATPLNTPTKPFDSQSGFNVHTIVLNIPLTQLGGAKIAGVYATTSRTLASLIDDDSDGDEKFFKQVGRQGNPLFCEVFIAEVDKDRYNQTDPIVDAKLFAKYADNPEVSRTLNLTPLVTPIKPSLLHAIYIPDMIKVDLTTLPARLAGTQGFSRLGLFGGDVLKSQVQDPFQNGGIISGGWPNGRRFGDDVVNIGLIALGVAGPDVKNVPPNFNRTRVDHNDITYNVVFPYAATPHNGRNINPSTPSSFTSPPSQ